MPARSAPAAEFDVDEELVRALLSDQHPDLSDLPLSPLAEGWDNVIFRLGESSTVRLPRRELGAGALLHEQRWLPELAPRLPIPVPAPVRTGRPALGYPWHWSVCPWLPGCEADEAELADPAREAQRLGSFLAALHVQAPRDAPVNPVRAHAVAELSDRIEIEAAALVPGIEVDAVRALWGDLAATDPWDGPPVWAHGDLHAANVLVDRGEITAVIDFGDVTAGDPAVDLAVGWMLFDGPARQRFRAAAGADDEALWRRGRAWALHFALIYLAHAADDPRVDRMGRHLLPAVIAG